MTERYTAADFANARFAEHESGMAIAFRWTSDYTDKPVERWTYERPSNNRFSKEATHQEMADMNGWVPVPTKPTKPTITVSQYRELIEDLERRTTVPSCAFERAGIEIIPDPEPTNTDKLEQLIRESGYEVFTLGHLADARELAEWLNNDGVTAPKED